jgi:anti-anti-sigma regulatory factor
LISERPTVFNFPPVVTPLTARGMHQDLLSALRDHRRVVLLDLSGRDMLNDKDIDLLLDCLACAAGRDVTVVLVTNSRPVRTILEVARVASLTRICDSLDEALADFEAEGSRSSARGPMEVGREMNV